MPDQIKLLRPRNIKLMRREAGTVLTVGEDILEGAAANLVRIRNAEWHTPNEQKKSKKDKKPNPAEENKAMDPVEENKVEGDDE